MTKIQDNKHLLGVISEIKSSFNRINTFFVLPEKGPCVLVANTSSQGDNVAIFETEDGSEVFHYNFQDAILENQDVYPVGETFYTPYGDRFIVIAAFCQKDKKNKSEASFYLCKQIEPYHDESSKGSGIFSCFDKQTLGRYILIEQPLSYDANILEWIRSHDPEYDWDFSNPDGTTKYLVRVIAESGGLDLKSLIKLIDENKCFDEIPVPTYDKWIDWSKG